LRCGAGGFELREIDPMSLSCASEASQSVTLRVAIHLAIHLWWTVLGSIPNMIAGYETRGGKVKKKFHIRNYIQIYLILERNYAR
jgi:hypothetical protein